MPRRRRPQTLEEAARRYEEACARAADDFAQKVSPEWAERYRTGVRSAGRRWVEGYRRRYVQG